MLRYTSRFSDGWPPSARVRRNAVRSLSGMGFDPFTLIKGTAEAVKGVFDVFGPTEEFQEAQAVRDAYNAMADSLRDSLPLMPEGAVKSSMRAYLPVTRSVIARGAQASDLAELRAKINQWGAMSDAAVTAPSFEMAGLPWYVWLIAAGVLLPMVLKRK